MGESLDDVLALGYALRALRIDSIPVNFLIPIPGTPLAGRPWLGPRLALRILCLFRLLNPTAELRIAGGREVQLRWLQPLGLEVANSIFVGDYLTTTGQPPEADFAMLRDLGLSILGQSDPVPETPTVWGGHAAEGAGRLTRRPNA
jgi:biotin synthase